MANYVNEVIRAIHERRSIRSFKPDMPSDEEIAEVVEAGLYAASARDSQPNKTIVVKDTEWKRRIVEANARIWGVDDVDPFYGAPVIIIVVGKAKYPNCVYDGSLVLGNMMHAAHSIGLGSCWIHRAKEEFETEEFMELLRVVGIEEECIGVGHLALGYIDGEAPPARPRHDGRVYYL